MPGRAALAALALVTAAGEDAPLELPPNVELRPVPRRVAEFSHEFSQFSCPRGGSCTVRGGLLVSKYSFEKSYRCSIN